MDQGSIGRSPPLTVSMSPAEKPEPLCSGGWATLKAARWGTEVEMQRGLWGPNVQKHREVKLMEGSCFKDLEEDFFFHFFFLL